MIHLNQNKRYTVYIEFRNSLLNRTPPIKESFKTLAEALTYRDLIDESVRVANITDNVNGKLIEWK